MPRLARASVIALLSTAFVLAAAGCATAEEVDDGDVGQADEAFSSGPIAELSPAEWAELRARCPEAPADAPALGYGDYAWNSSLEDMDARYRELYASPKRLRDHAFVAPDEDRIVLYVHQAWGRTVTVSPRLVKSVQKHIEKALSLGYVDYVFFPDMGHAHFFMEKARWDAEYAGFPVPKMADLYTKMFADPNLRILYHTAEQLRMTDEDGALLPDRKLQFRFFTRNVIGDNRGQGIVEPHHAPDSKANTLGALEGHHYFGGGFHVSAHQNGCFPFTHRGETFYFDLSLAGLDP